MQMECVQVHLTKYKLPWLCIKVPYDMVHGYGHQGTFSIDPGVSTSISVSL